MDEESDFWVALPIPDDQSGIATIAVITPPVTEAPSTPRTLTRPPGFGVPSTQPSRSFVRTPSLSENKFTTLPLNYQSRSPSIIALRSLKRNREASIELDIDNPPPTRKSMRLAAAVGSTK
ncbi:hypothetical protein AZE42_11344 [Rhizopogon vesiculosus]|uniref:Uncharacterized protein n=1 Tax=Rhizopogon vesiculosus TaxID=180088 RepID=A0A1J8PXB2_9AGAM|nr:hypothetical protein AZE42_11344 [Rhizopogon vesiculosus]